MKVRVEVVSLNADGEQQRRQILTIERRELTMETLGMNLTEGKPGSTAEPAQRCYIWRRSGHL
jgi:hypothetical protein